MNLLMLSGDTSIARGQHESIFGRMLAHFARHWEHIDILCPRAAGAMPQKFAENVEIHPASSPKLRQPAYILRTGLVLCAQRRYDLIASHDYGLFLNGWGAWRLSRKSGIPYVSEIHHVEGYPRAVTWRERLYRVAATLYIRWVWPRAAAIRVVNRVEMPALLRRLGVPEDKILVLPSLFIDFEIFHPVDEPLEYDVIFVGRLAPNKGLFTILEALSQVKTIHPKIKACFLGTGPLEGAVKARIAALGLEQHVTMIPRVETVREVACLYNRSRMLVCASTSEGGPRVAGEAMACGTPVISTPVGLMNELIEDGANGMLFDGSAAQLAKKIGVLLADEALRKQMGEKGRESVMKFGAEAIITAYAQGYHELIRRSRGGG